MGRREGARGPSRRGPTRTIGDNDGADVAGLINAQNHAAAWPMQRAGLVCLVRTGSRVRCVLRVKKFCRRLFASNEARVRAKRNATCVAHGIYNRRRGLGNVHRSLLAFFSFLASSRDEKLKDGAQSRADQKSPACNQSASSLFFRRVLLPRRAHIQVGTNLTIKAGRHISI